MPRIAVFRAGDEVEDLCRACKTDRMHTVIVVDGDGWPLRVPCGFCQSRAQLPRRAAQLADVRRAPTPERQRPNGRSPSRARAPSAQPPRPRAVSARQRSRKDRATHDASGSSDDLELLLRRIIREEAGITPVTPAEKWRGGTLVLRPGTPGLQEKSWPIETFFHKVVMLRNRLRTLEQQVNASDLPDDVKVKLQSYVSGCYGSLTSFNVLFADEDDQFKGSGGDLGGSEDPLYGLTSDREDARRRADVHHAF